MRFKRSSTDGSGSLESLYGESHPGTDLDHDEQTLYGEPCHETRDRRDEQTLYGEPQHEQSDESDELPDLELLFARMRAESVHGPVAFSPREESPKADATER